MIICKTFTFDAAHRLPNLPPEHKCHQLHGHTYRVDIVIKSKLPVGELENGWVLDYADIAKAWDPVFAVIDHHYLNEIPGLETPTTEVLAAWLYAQLAPALTGPLYKTDISVGIYGNPIYELAKIRVYESSTTYCEFP